MLQTITKAHGFLKAYNYPVLTNFGCGFYPPMAEPMFVFVLTSEQFITETQFKTDFLWNLQTSIFLFVEERFLHPHGHNSLLSLMKQYSTEISGVLFECSTIFELQAALESSLGPRKFTFTRETRYRLTYTHNQSALPLKQKVVYSPSSVRFACKFEHAVNGKTISADIVHNAPCNYKNINKIRSNASSTAHIQKIYEYVERNVSELGSWPIPMRSALNENEFSQNVEASVSYPHIYFVEGQDVKWPPKPQPPYARYTLDPQQTSAIYEELNEICKRTYYKIFICYGSKSDYENSRPFGYIKKSSASETPYYWLYVLPYNFPTLFRLLDHYNRQQQPSFYKLTLQSVKEEEDLIEQYVKSLPSYYISPMKELIPKFTNPALCHKMLQALAMHPYPMGYFDAMKLPLFNHVAKQMKTLFVQFRKSWEDAVRVGLVSMNNLETTPDNNDFNVSVKEITSRFGKVVVGNAFDVPRDMLVMQWNLRLKKLYNFEYPKNEIDPNRVSLSDCNSIKMPQSVETILNGWGIMPRKNESAAKLEYEKEINENKKCLQPRSELQEQLDGKHAVSIKQMSDYNEKRNELKRTSLRPLDENMEAILDKMCFGNPYRFSSKMSENNKQDFGGDVNPGDFVDSGSESNYGSRWRIHAPSKQKIETRIKRISDLNVSRILIERMTLVAFDERLLNEENDRSECLLEVKTQQLLPAIEEYEKKNKKKAHPKVSKKPPTITLPSREDKIQADKEAKKSDSPVSMTEDDSISVADSESSSKSSMSEDTLANGGKPVEKEKVIVKEQKSAKVGEPAKERRPSLKDKIARVKSAPDLPKVNLAQPPKIVPTVKPIIKSLSSSMQTLPPWEDDEENQYSPEEKQMPILPLITKVPNPTLNIAGPQDPRRMQASTGSLKTSELIIQDRPPIFSANGSSNIEIKLPKSILRPTIPTNNLPGLISKLDQASSKNSIVLSSSSTASQKEEHQTELPNTRKTAVAHVPSKKPDSVVDLLSESDSEDNDEEEIRLPRRKTFKNSSQLESSFNTVVKDDDDTEEDILPIKKKQKSQNEVSTSVEMAVMKRIQRRTIPDTSSSSSSSSSSDEEPLIEVYKKFNAQNSAARPTLKALPANERKSVSYAKAEVTNVPVKPIQSSMSLKTETVSRGSFNLATRTVQQNPGQEKGVVVSESKVSMKINSISPLFRMPINDKRLKELSSIVELQLHTISSEGEKLLFLQGLISEAKLHSQLSLVEVLEMKLKDFF